MRLIHKTTLSWLIFSVIILAAGGYFIYERMKTVMEDEISEKLLANSERIVDAIARGKEIPDLPPVMEIELLRDEVPEFTALRKAFLMDPVEVEDEYFAELTVVKRIGTESYRIILRQVIPEPHDYYYTIGFSLIPVMILMLGGLLLINFWVSKRTWKPFYRNLEKLKEYSLEGGEELKLKGSGIKEFAEMNSAIGKLTARISADYGMLKAFTENASHEIQTPLAIIRNKLDAALQHPQLDQDQAALIMGANQAAQRLERLNRALLLLTRIENRQFGPTEELSVAEQLKKLLGHLDELISSEGLTADLRIKDPCSIRSNKTLHDTLLSNLVRNAIRHNIPDGYIRITIEKDRLMIRNSGKPLDIPAEKIFDRFVKSPAKPGSLGLGLAISQKICEMNGWTICYSSDETDHIFTILF